MPLIRRHHYNPSGRNHRPAVARGYPVEVGHSRSRRYFWHQLVDQVRSLAWERRYIKVADVGPVQLLDEVRERLAARSRRSTNHRSRNGLKSSGD